MSNKNTCPRSAKSWDFASAHEPARPSQEPQPPSPEPTTMLHYKPRDPYEPKAGYMLMERELHSMDHIDNDHGAKRRWDNSTCSWTDELPTPAKQPCISPILDLHPNQADSLFQECQKISPLPDRLKSSSNPWLRESSCAQASAQTGLTSYAVSQSDIDSILGTASVQSQSENNHCNTLEDMTMLFNHLPAGAESTTSLEDIENVLLDDKYSDISVDSEKEQELLDQEPPHSDMCDCHRCFYKNSSDAELLIDEMLKDIGSPAASETFSDDALLNELADSLPEYFPTHIVDNSDTERVTAGMPKPAETFSVPVQATTESRKVLQDPFDFLNLLRAVQIAREQLDKLDSGLRQAQQ